MKRLLTTALFLCLATTLSGLASCTPDDAPETPAPPSLPEAPAPGPSPGPAPAVTRALITVGGETFAATLADSDAARAFARLLPLEIRMRELNGNEKYAYLPGNLPAAPIAVRQIRTGDLMLYGNDCLVLFYDSFTTAYSYTRIGCVDDPDRLQECLGAGDATVRFEPAPDA